MPYKVIWRRLAEQDLTDAYLFIGLDSPTMAEKLIDAVEAAVTFLMAHPQAGRLEDFASPEAQDIRSWPLRGFRAWLIFYRSTHGELEILRFLHSSRDLPGELDP